MTASTAGIDNPPFQKGQRVRMKPEFRADHPQLVSFAGTVVSVRKSRSGAWWQIAIRRDRLSLKSKYTTHVAVSDPNGCRWELVPMADLSLDEIACSLARAVLAGDSSAARPLADRVMEIVNG